MLRLIAPWSPGMFISPKVGVQQHQNRCGQPYAEKGLLHSDKKPSRYTIKKV